jgi:hypothetical protein
MDDIQRMIEAYRARTVPDASTKAALLRRLQARPRDPRRLALAVALSVGIAAAILLAIAALSRVLAPPPVVPVKEEAVYGAASRPAERGEVVERERVLATTPRAPAEPSSSLPALATESTRIDRPRPRSTTPSRASDEIPSSDPSPSSDAPASTIAAEARLLTKAQQALASSPRRALALLDEHAQRFPSGAMALEREALRAIASCDAGLADAPARARALLARPDVSSYAARIRRACES